MTANPEGRVTLTCDQAHTLAMAALTGLGYPTDEALLITHHVMDAALCGYEYSGLAKIVNLAQIRAQRPSVGPMRLLQETSVSALYDGCHHNGMITIDRATDVAIVKAQDHGFGIVGVHRTWMSGRSAYFVERIARAGLVGLHTLGSTPLVAPPGAAVAAIGTNPIAFGFPTLGDPLVIDMGFSTLMFTDLRLRARLGQPLPEGCAIDAQGFEGFAGDKVLSGVGVHHGADCLAQGGIVQGHGSLLAKRQSLPKRPGLLPVRGAFPHKARASA